MKPLLYRQFLRDFGLEHWYPLQGQLESDVKLWQRHYLVPFKRRAMRSGFSYVVWMACQVSLRDRYDIAELANAGAIGLAEAIDKWNPDSGVRFTSYAKRRVHGAMQDFARDLDDFSRLTRKRLREWNRVREHFINAKGRKPTYEEMRTMVSDIVFRTRDRFPTTHHPLAVPGLLTQAGEKHPTVQPDTDRIANTDIFDVVRDRLTARQQSVFDAMRHNDVYGKEGQPCTALVARKCGLSVWHVAREINAIFAEFATCREGEHA